MGTIKWLLGVIIWLIPFYLVWKSDKTTGNEKLAWLVAIFFTNWIGLLIFYLVAPLKK